MFIDSYFDTQETYVVRANYYKGGFLATNYLLEKAHKKVAIVTGSEIKNTEELEKNKLLLERYNGYKKAVERYNSETYSFEEDLTIKVELLSIRQ